MASAPSPITNPIVLNLTDTWGAAQIGCYVGFTALGINIIQVYMYYWSNETDPLFLRALVAILLIFDILSKIFSVRQSWSGLITHWGDVSNLTVFRRDAYHAQWMEYIVIGAVQYYYMRRILKFAIVSQYGRSWLLWISFILLAVAYLAQFGLLIWFEAYFFETSNAADVYGRFATIMGPAVLASSAFVDVAIAAGMLVLLKTQSDGSFYAPTTHMLRRLTVLIVNTGLLTAIIAVGTCILEIITQSSSLWDAVPQYSISSIYFSGLLANLNARQYIRGNEDIVISDLRATAPSYFRSTRRSEACPRTDALGGGTINSERATIAEITVITDKRPPFLDESGTGVLDTSKEIRNLGADAV